MSLHEAPVQVLSPWLEHPFRLLNWLDMLEFSALRFYKIGQNLELIMLEADHYDSQAKLGKTEVFVKALTEINEQCAPIGLTQSAHLAKYISNKIEPGWSVEALKISLDSLDSIIRNEIRVELFLWISPEKAPFYSKTAEEFLDKRTLRRFATSNIEKEAEEAMKSYALNRNTACVHHLMRLLEAGKEALGSALGVPPKHTDRGAVFQEYDKQFNSKPQDRPQNWQTHGQFLVEISGDLKAAEKTWRHHAAHGGKFYDETEAQYVLQVVPRFMKHLATRLDETGKLHSP